MKTSLALLAISLLCAGCATSPVPASQARAIPAERLLGGYSSIAGPASNLAHVTIVRDSGITGSAPSAKLSIDGEDIAKLRTRERLDVYLKPGPHIFGVVPSPQLGGAITEATFNVTTDKQSYFRISISAGGDFGIQPSTHLND